jgi:DNA repair photolyase
LRPPLRLLLDSQPGPPPHRFQKRGTTAFKCEDAVVDPNIPELVRAEALKLGPGNTVMLCTTTDAWAPEAQQYNLGRRCLEALLEGTKCQVRILTKNAAVERDLDLIARYKDRVHLGLSLTAPRAKAHLATLLEPQASPMAERLRGAQGGPPTRHPHLRHALSLPAKHC